MSDLSTTAASNSPAGSESPTAGDDFLRAIQAIVRTTNAKGSDIASATSTAIGAATGEFVDVTGTTTITSFDTIAAGIVRTVRFTGALTLTHNATSLILPGSANITTANGDTAIFRSLGSGNWKCIAYQPVNGSTVTGTFVDSGFRITGSSDATKLIAFEVDTNIPTATTVTVTPQSTSGTMALVQGQIQPITASVGSNALTITLNPTSLAFRSATIGSGTINVRAINTAISVVVSSGSTLGTVNAIQSRLIVLAIDNAGTVELAVVNLAGLTALDETGVITTTAEGGAGAADSINIIYSTTARTSVPYRVVGYVESTQATAGTWATAPSTIQGIGGQALAALNSLGYGQSYVNQTGSRAVSTTYYNTTGRPRYILVYGSAAATSATITLSINGAAAVNIGRTDLPSGTAVANGFAIIPPFASYLIAGITAITSWVEFG